MNSPNKYGYSYLNCPFCLEKKLITVPSECTVGFLYSIYYTVKKHLFVWGFLWWLIKWSIQKREREREDWRGHEKLQNSIFFSSNRWRQAWSKPMTFANFKFCGWVINYHTSRPHTAQCYKIQKKLQKKNSWNRLLSK